MLIGLQDAVEPGVFGGKAAMLARLAVVGYPVPPAVVLSARTPVTSELLAELAEWAGQNARFGVVARSSAAAEDGKRASYAGVFASCFSPAEPAALAAAVACVRDSGQGEAARAYRLAHGLDGDTSGIAVIVQAAVRPRTAGVAFADQSAATWIEATWGLANLLLAGHTPPDAVTVSTSGIVTVERVADKPLTSLPATAAERDIPPGEWIPEPGLGWRAKLAHADPDQGLLYLATPDDKAGECCLCPGTAREVARIAQRSASELGLGQVDLEWATDSAGNIHVLQARPVTASVPHREPARFDGPVGNRLWRGVSASAGQAVGPTRVLTGAARPGDFPAGHILVTASAGPDLMPALIACDAVIAPDAGVLCHTAIVARELGLPCVVGLHDAITDFPTGTHVTVDGTAGTVTKHLPGSASGWQGASTSKPSPAPGSAVTDSDSWPVVLSIDDIPKGATVVLALDAATASNVANAPALLEAWSAAGIGAVLAPAGIGPLPGMSARLRVEGGGELYFPTACRPPETILVTSPAGETLFRARILSRAESGQPGVTGLDQP